LARLGLERAGFEVVWSNDQAPAKRAMYQAHFQDGPERRYVVGDVGALPAADLPGDIQLAWASSPCTDLSLAGTRSGLAGRSSGAFWSWVQLLRQMGTAAPAVVVLENVTGLATSHGGADLRAAIGGLNQLGYSIDLLVLDARRFLPQSRPRLFLVGALNPPADSDEVRLRSVLGHPDEAAAAEPTGAGDVRTRSEPGRTGGASAVTAAPAGVVDPWLRPEHDRRRGTAATAAEPSGASDSQLRPAWVEDFYDDPSLVMHRAPLPEPPPLRTTGLGQLVEELPPDDPRWWEARRTEAFVASLAPLQRQRLAELCRRPGRTYRTAYRRTRRGVAVWEIRADDVAGCLRTVRGGSSKQAVVRVDGQRLRIRWLTPLECARLMGAGDFKLDGLRTTQALFAFGDAVAVPAVEWLAREYLHPLATGQLGAERTVPTPDRPDGVL
jgi:site-specific DNA-cytosine methylase